MSEETMGNVIEAAVGPKPRGRRVRFLWKGLAFLALFLLLDTLFLLLAYRDDNVFAAITEAKVSFLEREVFEAPRVAEVLVLGSSHAQFGVDAALLGEALERRAINLGYGGGAHVGDQYLLLEAYLERKPAPELVVHALDSFSLNFEPHAEISYLESLVAHRTTPWRGPLEVAKRRLRFASNAYKHGRNLPRYVQEALLEGRFTPPSAREETTYDLQMFSRFEGYQIEPTGWVAGDGLLNHDFVRYADLAFEPREDSLEALRHIVSLCRDRGIPLVLIHVPEHEVARRPKERYEDFARWIDAFAKRENLAYLDLNHEERFPIDRDELFFDSDHLNREGARLFTQRLGAWLSQVILPPAARR